MRRVKTAAGSGLIEQITARVIEEYYATINAYKGKLSAEQRDEILQETGAGFASALELPDLLTIMAEADLTIGDLFTYDSSTPLIEVVSQAAGDILIAEAQQELAAETQQQAIQHHEQVLGRAQRCADAETDKYEVVIMNAPQGPGKFEAEGAVGEWVYDQLAEWGDTGFGDVDSFGGYYQLAVFEKPVLVKEPDGTSWTFTAAITEEISNGFINFSYFDTAAEAEAKYAEIEAEYGKWSEEAGDY